MLKIEKLIGNKVGKYELTRLLNEGGYGWSFVGLHEDTKDIRVVKISKAALEAANDKLGLEIFNREGVFLSKLKHKQIVKLLEQGEAHGHQYMVVDYIQGFELSLILRTLRERKSELKCNWNDLMDVPTAFAIICSILQPLAYSHKVSIELPGKKPINGLAHRDITPGHILLGKGQAYSGAAYFIDFGSAKTGVDFSYGFGRDNPVCPRYMSPMRIHAKYKRASKGGFWGTFQQGRHDVHSVGCIFYELLTGMPFINSSELMMCVSMINNEETYLEAYDNLKELGFQRDIIGIIKKSIVKPDYKRSNTPYQYKSAGDMLEDCRLVYSRLSGGAPIADVLRELVSELDEPQKKMNLRKTTRIARFAIDKVGTGLVNNNNAEDSKKAAVIVLILAAIIFALFYFFGFFRDDEAKNSGIFKGVEKVYKKSTDSLKR